MSGQSAPTSWIPITSLACDVTPVALAVTSLQPNAPAPRSLSTNSAQQVGPTALSQGYHHNGLPRYCGVLLVLCQIEIPGRTHPADQTMDRGMETTGVGHTYEMSSKSPGTIASPVPPHNSETNGVMLAEINAARLGAYAVTAVTPENRQSIAIPGLRG